MKFRTILAVSAALAFTAPAQAQLLAGEKEADIPAIAGVIADDAEWEREWMGPMTADGMSTGADGALLFAQEQSNAIWKLWADGAAFIEWPYVTGAGAVSVDAQGRAYAVERGCTDPGLGGMTVDVTCSLPSRVVQLAPEYRVIADKFADGTTLGRLNDLEADGRGGAFFTQGALYHVDAAGNVTTVATVERFTNGVALSPDGKHLYVTDAQTIHVLDVSSDGAASNKRVFAKLSETQGFGGDGLEVDSEGRLYVTGDAGVYVFAPDGAELGVIPAPRRTITLAFGGPDRQTLYVGAMGAVDPDGKLWETPQGVRNVAMTIYKVETIAKGKR
jgi:sugar lactone lactonase YvrE